MKENFGIDSLSTIPLTEGNSQQGRFEDLENLNSLTKSSLDLGLWGFFCFSKTQITLFCILLSFIFAYDEFYCHTVIHYDVSNLSLLIN